MTKFDLVVCAGMRRAASVVQYRIARDIVLEQGGSDIGWVSWQEFDKLYDGHARRPKIVKSHVFLPLHSRKALALFQKRKACAILSHRDIRDVIGSLMRARGLRECDIERETRAVLNEYEKWGTVADVMTSRYDDIFADIKWEVYRISNFLGKDVLYEDADPSKYTLDHLRAEVPPTGGAHHLSGLAKDHIGDGGHYDLLPKYRERVEAVAMPWLIEHGYAPEIP